MIALAKPNKIISLHPNEDNEWYTPYQYVGAARELMHGIALDPASSAVANQIVQAERYYTKEENGLAQAWNARSVWLNPPYGRVNGSGKSVIRMFVTRLVEEYKAKNIEQAVLLVTVQTNSTWFQSLWEYPICFTSHRVAFLKPNHGRLEADSRTSHTLGTALVYLGKDEQRFVDIFSKFGCITKAIDTPKVHPINLSLWEVQS